VISSVRAPATAGSPIVARGRGVSVSQEALAVPGELVDGLLRRVRYLRVSVTDRCNYRCSYCIPDEDLEFQRKDAVLSFEEIARVVAVFAALGVRKVRLTGGEPTVRGHIAELVTRVASVPGIDQVVMTSNGHLLADLARPLRDAGLHGVNVSLDTLDEEQFHAITVHGNLSRVLAGIDAALAAGLAVKLNAVALAETFAQVVPLCEFAWQRGIPVRFIEHMPMSAGATFHREQRVSAGQIRAEVERGFGPLVAATVDTPDGGPARYWRLADRPSAQLGIISAMTEHFCDSCNRLRLTATGELHACLGYDDARSLRDIIREGGDDVALRHAITEAVRGKRPGHEFQTTGSGGPSKHMISIGG
jgi:cyclic pyranopterin phosphate synthase